MAQKKFSELEAGSVDGTSIFAQTKTEDGSLVSKSASSTSLAGYIGTSHQFAGLNTKAKDLVRAINEAAKSGGGASVVQLTQAEYTALTSAEKMNGSIYKLTDKAIFYCLDEEYHPVKELTTAQYEALTTAEKNNGTIYIQTDAETTGSDIPVSSGATETIAEMFVNNGITLTKESNIDTFEYACRKVGKVVSLSVVFNFSGTPTYNQTIASNLPAPSQQLQIFVCCVAGTNSGKVSRARISNTGLLTDWYSSPNFFKTGDTYLISAMYLSAN